MAVHVIDHLRDGLRNKPIVIGLINDIHPSRHAIGADQVGLSAHIPLLSDVPDLRMHLRKFGNHIGRVVGRAIVADQKLVIEWEVRGRKEVRQGLPKVARAVECNEADAQLRLLARGGKRAAGG